MTINDLSRDLSQVIADHTIKKRRKNTSDLTIAGGKSASTVLTGMLSLHLYN